MKKKEIWFEATQLLKSPLGHQSGIGYYTENIITNLVKHYNDYNYKIVGNIFINKNVPTKLAAINNDNFLLTRYIPAKLWSQSIKLGILPHINLIHKGSPDLVINFDFVRAPVSKKVKTITVIHDLAYEVYPQYTEKRNLQRLKKLVPKSLKMSTRIVAVSESTKKDLISNYNVNPNKIDVVYNAVDTKLYKPKALTKEIRNKYNLPKKYLLYLGNIEPRKNIKGIIEAYSMLPDEISSEYKLVLSGGRGWNQGEINNALKQSAKKDNIIFTGYIDDRDKPELYAGADIFLFPSHYEGFGLPILEAMACGVPVITADNSSLREVADKAALYVNSKSTKELLTAIIKIVMNKRIRQDLINKGNKRVKEFNWKDSANEINKSILKALNE